MVRIRDATAADAVVAGRIVLDAYLSVPGYRPAADYQVELADVASRLPPAGEVLVAEHDGHLVGCITYVPGPESPLSELLEPGEAGIRMLAVAAGARGRGAGSLLVEACVDRARSRGRRALWLHSTPQMHEAHRMYGRLGFRRAPERDWEPVPGLLLLAFRLPLDEERSLPTA